MKKSLLLFAAFLIPMTVVADELGTVTVQDQDSSSLDALGFDVPFRDLPLSTRIISTKALQDQGVHRLSDVTLLDASVTDSYNASGYWDYLSIRGFTLDNRYNFLREGLPINAQTSIPLDNKDRIEVLKGLSGIQAGSASPGGMVNFVVKRPTDKPLLVFNTEISSEGNWLLGADTGGRVSGAEQFGYRLNVAHENLRPPIDSSSGHRSVISLAHDWRAPENSLLESDIEWSRKSQPTQAAFSLLGNTLPSVQNPRVNLNNQSWSEPVVFAALTATLRWTQKLNPYLIWTTTAGIQNLKTDDRLAYPYGCSAENNYDRYCSDGSFDMYDFRSDNERRNTQSVKTALQLQTQTGQILHQLNAGYIGAKMQEDYQRQAYNFVGTGNINGRVQLPGNGTLNDENTDRDSAVSEFFFHDAASFGAWKGWLGVRVTDIERSSVRTDGSRATSFRENFVLPWVALSYQISEDLLTYISYGEGVETYVTPNRSGYSSPGQFVPDVISRQFELGLRQSSETWSWGLAAFHISRPVVEDARPDFQIDGKAVHQGLELDLEKKWSQTELTVSGMWLQAARTDSALNPTINGKRPVNLPEHTVRLRGVYYLSSVPGLSLDARASYEGERAVVVDNSIMLDAWTRWDVGGTYRFGPMDKGTELRLAVENVLNQKYWKESPTQYGHIYLYPGMERLLTLSAQTNF
ncbi:TonB-dependent siderophore receptor [Bdellovibrio bacteriovorus]|uniref:TonB-dependent siderophore receptor n=1 Tax=Bdellovibrio bacteriovorus TaxID=959 RepID=UPI0021CEBEE3|nr:TonB-dependent siderophore receptor [Bdellovibrio bacteriovorus]UXR63933.1 TonB-dependent siderophore receptor [Bdellovibrio bacteriovorus]